MSDHDGERPKACTAEYVAMLKAQHVADGLCVDCNRPAAYKRNGKRARKCKYHLSYDRRRWRAKQRGTTIARRPYKRLRRRVNTRAERRSAHRDAGLCACGKQRTALVRTRKGEVAFDEHGNPMLAKSCVDCLARSHGTRLSLAFCVDCQATGSHRDGCPKE